VSTNEDDLCDCCQERPATFKVEVTKLEDESPLDEAKYCDDCDARTDLRRIGLFWAPPQGTR